jgi:5-methylcytosine-specific restriction enzyme A
LRFTLKRATDAPQTTCGHLDPDHRCDECWLLIKYLARKFALDSWVTPKPWETAWYALKGMPNCIDARRVAIAMASAEEKRAIERWKEDWKSKPAVECYWCRRSFSPADCHVDHVVPIVRDGEHSLTNLVIACASCNFRKHDLMPEQWLSVLAAQRA